MQKESLLRLRRRGGGHRMHAKGGVVGGRWMGLFGCAVLLPPPLLLLLVLPRRLYLSSSGRANPQLLRPRLLPRAKHHLPDSPHASITYRACLCRRCMQVMCHSTPHCKKARTLSCLVQPLQPVSKVLRSWLCKSPQHALHAGVCKSRI